MMAIQISVFLENKSGRLAEVTHALAGAGVNIRALSLAETIDYGVLRLSFMNVSALPWSCADSKGPCHEMNHLMHYERSAAAQP